MESSKILKYRLKNQSILKPHKTNPASLTEWMGAIQAQDYEMTKWALGVRLPGLTLEDIEKAIGNGHIIRTHLLRPTWHFAAAKDLRWMIDLTAPRIRTAMKSHEKKLGLTEKVISKSNRIIEKALFQNNRMTRSELVNELEKAGFNNKKYPASLLLMNAELDKIICSGPTIGKNYTYALFEKRIPSSKSFSKEEALEKLVKTYFRSHGPATLDDFSWWSGLTKTQARKALSFIKDELCSEEFNTQKYWFYDSLTVTDNEENSVYLLPAYDEFLISYKNRSASIRIENQKKAISNNGIFRPIIVVNGEVIGTWKRSEKEKSVYVETNFFINPEKKIILSVNKSAEKFADFLGKDLKVNHVLNNRIA